MKKFLIFFATVAIVYGLQACNNNQNSQNSLDSTDSIYNEKDENNRNLPPPPPMSDDSTLLDTVDTMSLPESDKKINSSNP